MCITPCYPHGAFMEQKPSLMMKKQVPTEKNASTSAKSSRPRIGVRNDPHPIHHSLFNGSHHRELLRDPKTSASGESEALTAHGHTEPR